MKIFGYERDQNDLLELEEISFKISPNEVAHLIDFFKETHQKMVEYERDFGHEHFKDWLRETQKSVENIDVIVVGE